MASGVVIVMLALERIGRVAFASAGDNEWTISSWVVNQLDRTLWYQGKLYVVNWEDRLTHVSVIDPPPPQCEEEGSKGEGSSEEEESEGEGSSEEEGSTSEQTIPPPRTVVTCSSEEIHLPYLVELNSEIMLVGYNDSSFSHILVLKLADLVLGRIVPVRSIRDNVLFAGGRSLCVSSSWLPSIGANSVVCFHAGEKYLARYDLSSGTHLPPMDITCLALHHVLEASYITSLPAAIDNSGTKD